MSFTLPGPFSDQTPFEELHVWQWARAQTCRPDVTLGRYLQSVGFVLGRDRLTESQYQTLQYALGHFHRIAPHFVGELRFSEAFTPAGSGFYVAGRQGRYSLAPQLREALEAAGWIYEVTPETTYFEVIRGTLCAKYQQILGSRALARIVD